MMRVVMFGLCCMLLSKNLLLIVKLVFKKEGLLIKQ
jgi:hypothetical protein